MLHFDKYRATALSLLYGVGWGLSGIIGQLILSGLMEKYGFRGAVLLVGGIMMHSIPIVMLAKNPSPMCIGCKWCRSTSVDNQESGMHGARSEENVTNPGNANELQEKRPIAKSPLQESSSLRHALALFVMPSFYVIVAVIIIDDYSAVQFSTTIVDYAIDKGIAFDAAKTLISFAALGGLIGRGAIPFIADILPRMRTPLYVLGFIFVSALLFPMPSVPAYAGVATITVIHGVCKGTLLCFRAVIIAELLGVDRTAACCGVTGMAMIPLSLVSPMIVGSYRDGKGTYDGFYQMLAAVNLAAALVFGVFSVWNRRR
ncbi:monocarboxylate transporter 12-like [Dermacentor andersoni]|uniref:monocarboxylate transporter 12-like n=1 Tax=Dermacentor andersoni TaxID=34620 RepID=UPI002416B54B|nr:monocarboxylate transporter 3-like [Dermacentor andersoni]